MRTSILNYVIHDWSVTDIEKPSFGACNQVWRSWVRLNMIPLLVHSGWMWCVQLVDFCQLYDHITAVDITFLSQNFLTYHDLLWPVFTVFAQIQCVWNVIKQYALKMVCPGNPPGPAVWDDVTWQDALWRKKQQGSVGSAVVRVSAALSNPLSSEYLPHHDGLLGRWAL